MNCAKYLFHQCNRYNEGKHILTLARKAAEQKQTDNFLQISMTIIAIILVSSVMHSGFGFPLWSSFTIISTVCISPILVFLMVQLENKIGRTTLNDRAIDVDQFCEELSLQALRPYFMFSIGIAAILTSSIVPVSSTIGRLYLYFSLLIMFELICQ